MFLVVSSYNQIKGLIIKSRKTKISKDNTGKDALKPFHNFMPLNDLGSIIMTDERLLVSWIYGLVVL